MASGALVLTQGVQYMQVAGPGPVVVEVGGRETSGEGVSCLQPTSSKRSPIASNHFKGTILNKRKRFYFVPYAQSTLFIYFLHYFVFFKRNPFFFKLATI